MNKSLVEFLQRWAITTTGVLVAANVVPGLDYQRSIPTLLAASLLLGFLNATLRPLLVLLSIPLFCLSAGLFFLALPIINALLLMVVGKLVKGFTVTGFWPALFGSLIISLVSFAANGWLRKRPPPGGPKPGAGPGPLPGSGGSQPPPGQGPIIDV